MVVCKFVSFTTSVYAIYYVVVYIIEQRTALCTSNGNNNNIVILLFVQNSLSNPRRARSCATDTRGIITIYRTGTINTVRGSCLYASVQTLRKTEHCWMGVLEKSFFHGAYTLPGKATV